jgi:predicted nucleic acid-binding Zn ribbon protein
LPGPRLGRPCTGPDAGKVAQNRRRFRIAVLILFLVLALIAALAWLTERVTQGS